MPTNISSVIHYNRDENSFTARFFERLIIRFEQKTEDFSNFLSCVEIAASNNKKILENETLQPPTFGILKYEDSMPFLENVDMYSYCKMKGIEIEIDKDSIDKTEFDFVITAADDSNKSTIIVFEVKCFTDLKLSEIKRQNDILKKYEKAGLYDNFYHIALISYENIKHGVVPKQDFPEAKNFSIVTWEDVRKFIDFKRIKKDIEFSLLFKVIHLQNGDGKTRRFMIKT